jgi:alpha-beta hydrolase superfamily lysophospholipase
LDHEGRDRELEVFEGYYHEMHNEPPPLRAKVVQRLIDWIAART